MTYEPFPFDAFAKIVGGHNWVIARYSQRILDRYGDDVVCLTKRQYAEAAKLARQVGNGAANDA
jgi:hypothetical protein